MASVTYCRSLTNHHTSTLAVADYVKRLENSIPKLDNEVLRTPMLTKPYTDADLYLESKPSEEKINSIFGGLLEDMTMMFGPFIDGDADAVLNSLAVATRHRWVERKQEGTKLYKVSFRFFVQGLSIEYTDMLRLLNQAKASGRMKGEGWDGSVYKPREQLINCIYSYKHDITNDDERLMPASANDFSTPAYIVQALDGTEKQIVLPPNAERVHGGPDNVPVSVGVLSKLLACYSMQRCDEYDSWYKVLQAVINVYGHDGEGSTAVREWSKKSAKFDEHRFDYKWFNQITDNRQSDRLGMGSLIFWATQDAPDRADLVKLEMRHAALPSALFEDAARQEMVPDIRALYSHVKNKHVAKALQHALKGDMVYTQQTGSGGGDIWAVYGASRVGLWEEGGLSATVNFQMSEAVDSLADALLLPLYQLKNNLTGDAKDEIDCRIGFVLKMKSVHSDSSKLDGVRKMLGHLMYDPKFSDKLNSNPYLVPFDNGVYDLQAREFRELRREDYVSLTVGYDYSENVADKDLQQVDQWYERWLPVKEERDLVKRMAGYVICGDRKEKKVGLFVDYRDNDDKPGDNGKSQLLAFWKSTLGDFAAPTKTALLYAGKDRGIDEHNSGTMAFRYKRFAPFDETSPQHALDPERVKRCLAGGSTSDEQVRAAGSARTITQRWTVFGVIGCNQSNFPQTSAMDGTVKKRFITVPFRSKFSSDPAYKGQPHVFAPDPNMAADMQRLRSAHMRRMIQWYHEMYSDVTLSDEQQPASCLQLRDKIFDAADPALDRLGAFLDEHVVFGVQPDDMNYGKAPFLKRTELMQDIRARCPGRLFAGMLSKEFKEKIDKCMADRGYPFHAQKTITMQSGPRPFKDGYALVAWASDVAADETE